MYDENHNQISFTSTNVGYDRCNNTGSGFDDFLESNSALENYLCPVSRDDMALQGFWGKTTIFKEFDLLISY